MDDTIFTNTRLIMYHKQHTSARTLFLRLNNTVCSHPLPKLSQVKEADDEKEIFSHPALIQKQAEQLIQYMAQYLSIDAASIEADASFYEELDVPDGEIKVYLAQFTMMDPPRTEVAGKDGKMITIMEARGLPQTELELLRRAYAAIMEG